ncbi:PREDICTED: transcription factor TGA2.2-like isoform X2 [Lupinus angustifolius]|uniref:transcription factor TGA2.2-like isoform X2 n=1 Tax=Lupinus angustifolius TaxID=3871 RepID=UPI00092E798D|nr:PREDICTED: transcription factor TGA2.2-like isoform X2 [Lupinus angustifolius]
MESQRIGQMELSESGTSSHHVSYGVLHHGINIPTSSLMNQGSDFDFRELEEAMVLQGIKARNDEAKAALSTGRPAATLEMFPSWPMRFQQTPRGSSKSGGESTDSGSGVNTFCSSKTSEPPQFDTESPISKKASSSDQHHQVFDQQRQQNQLQQQPELMPFDASRTGPSLNQSPAKSTQDKKKGVGSISEKPLDAKTLRRLAQNREAAKKSRLRKKAYVQQLESSRLKLNQLEQDLQRARSQGMFLGCGGTGGNISSGAAMFDMEYGRWLEDDHRMMVELRAGLQAPLSDNELRVMVDGYLSHYDDIFRLKGMVAKTDVFHLINGMWNSQAERCFLWIGGFRPSELITMLIQQLEPLAEQQIMGMYGLRHSSHQAEEALSQGLEQLQQSLVETIAGGPVVDGVQQMMVAMGKLSNLEGFLRQADNLRQQSLHQICRLLTIRQVARCFIVIGEYYSRLRALSSLWTSRPRETLMGDDNSCQTTTDMQMVQASQNHFQSF